MKTVFVGGGEGCRAVLELVVQKRLATLSLDILGVVDIRPDAPGMRFAREHGWATFMELDSALALHEMLGALWYRMSPAQPATIAAPEQCGAQPCRSPSNGQATEPFSANPAAAMPS